MVKRIIYPGAIVFICLMALLQWAGWEKQQLRSTRLQLASIELPEPHVKAAPAQQNEVKELLWELLTTEVTYKKKYSQEYKMDFYYPVFGEKLKKFDGKEVYIAGYMIPLDFNEGVYALSYNPYSACYFCGGSGQETVIALKFKTKPKRYETDLFLTMKGILTLNETDVNDFIYSFKNTEEYKEKK